MTFEIEQLKARIKDLETDNEVLHTINTIQAERLKEWQKRLEAKEIDKALDELGKELLGY